LRLGAPERGLSLQAFQEVALSGLCLPKRPANSQHECGVPYGLGCVAGASKLLHDVVNQSYFDE
jgi:hypothetical protein